METLTLLRLLAVYVVLTAFERLTGAGALRALVNAYGVAMPFMLLAWFHLRQVRIEVPHGLLWGYGVLVAGIGLSVLFAGLYEVADLIKLLLAPLFAILGFNATPLTLDDPATRRQLRLLGAALMLPVLWALALNWLGSPGELGIFVNRNNAALYAVVLSNLLLLMGFGVGVVAGTLVVCALMFSTLGVVVAVLAALLVSLSVRKYLPAYLGAALLGLLLVFGPVQLPIGERLESVWQGVAAITSLGLWTELAHLSYADLYTLTGENPDLSLFFRLKHWEDLLLVWTSEGWVHLLFGLGIGSSPLHTEIGLVPHNDYLRLLIEVGPLGFIGFVWITGWLLWRIGRTPLLMSTAAVAIYFFTENLVTNFAAMTLYYWFAGYWAREMWAREMWARRLSAQAAPVSWRGIDPRATLEARDGGRAVVR